METVTQDKDASLNYWLDMSILLGARVIAGVQVDPDSELSGLTVVSQGVNTSELTDADGNTYAVGQVVGLQISGGSIDNAYSVVLRLTLDSGERDDRTIQVLIDDL